MTMLLCFVFLGVVIFLAAAIGWAAAPIHPIVADADAMASYNIQLEKIRINAAGSISFFVILPFG